RRRCWRAGAGEVSVAADILSAEDRQSAGAGSPRPYKPPREAGAPQRFWNALAGRNVEADVPGIGGSAPTPPVYRPAAEIRRFLLSPPRAARVKCDAGRVVRAGGQDGRGKARPALLLAPGRCVRKNTGPAPI